MRFRPAAALLLGSLAAVPARAQMGSVQNPPRQDLFHFAPQQRLNNGLGANAARPQPSATAQRNAQRTRRTHAAGN